MIQLNLLPDIKLAYIKAQRSRRLVMSVSVLVTSVAVALLVLLYGVGSLQKKHLSDLTKDINKESSQLQSKPDINKILTVQNQLESLTALHNTKPAASRLFDYLNQVTPTQVNITTLTVDFTKQTATVIGSSDALSSVNKYIDTLKYTKYTTDKNDKKIPAFTNIVLSSFGVNDEAKDKTQAASYTIMLSYDMAIFDITQKVNLAVPTLTTTRATVDQPSELFKAPVVSPIPASTTGGNH